MFQVPSSERETPAPLCRIRSPPQGESEARLQPPNEPRDRGACLSRQWSRAPSPVVSQGPGETLGTGRKVSIARAGWGQEAREPIKLACQTLDEGNAKKRLYAKKMSSHATNLVSGPQDVKQQPGRRCGAAWAPGPRDGGREAGRSSSLGRLGRDFDDKQQCA